MKRMTLDLSAMLCAVGLLLGMPPSPASALQPSSQAATPGAGETTAPASSESAGTPETPADGGVSPESLEPPGEGAPAPALEGGDPATGLETTDESPPASRPDLDAWDEADDLRLATIREEVRAMLTIQRVLSWYSSTHGEASFISDTYRGRESLFSSETIQFLERALARPDLDPDEARALLYLKHFLAVEYIELRASPFDDRLTNAEHEAKTRLSWKSEPVRYQELEAIAAEEQTPERRAEIQSAAARIWSDTLNPLLAEKEALVRTLAVDAGYPSYVALSEALRGVELKGLIRQAAAFLEDTDALYRKLLDAQAREHLKKPGDQVTRADLHYLTRPPAWHRYFPGGLELATFQHFLEGLGLSLESSAGIAIRIDAADRPEKRSDALCVPVRVPRDIRLSIKPDGGLEVFSHVFHEGGHALRHANTMTPVYEFQHMGSSAADEGYGELFRLAWGDPHWLKRYRRFIQLENVKHPRQRIPVLSDRELARIVRHRVFLDLYSLRRYAYARLIYEAILHGGSPELWRGVYTGPEEDLQTVYRQLFSRAYGFELTAEEALRFRTDVDDFFLSADFTRAFLLAHRLQESMREKLGPDWYGEKRAGELLKTLWHDGRKLTGEEVVRQLGDTGLSFDPVKRQLERLLREADALEAPRH